MAGAATVCIVRPLLVRCLRKDPRQRLQAIGDARIQIEELIGGSLEMEGAARALVRRRRGAAGDGPCRPVSRWLFSRPLPLSRHGPRRGLRESWRPSEPFRHHAAVRSAARVQLQ